MVKTLTSFANGKFLFRTNLSSPAFGNRILRIIRMIFTVFLDFKLVFALFYSSVERIEYFQNSLVLAEICDFAKNRTVTTKIFEFCLPV